MYQEQHIFPAVFNYASDGISVKFPDLPGCFLCGYSDDEAIKNAEEALKLHLYGLKEENEEIPYPSNITNTYCSDNEKVFLIYV